MSSGTSTDQFHVTNGQIISPDGKTFVARGINIMQGDRPSVSTIQNLFPGINFVRLPIYDYGSPDELASYVNQLNSAGIVVELEDHNNAGGAGGSQGVIFTGQALTTELNWYSSVAAAFKNNPMVWFGTNNEPSETDSSGNFNAAALSDWQKATYDAIRNAGNTAPVLLEANGWANNGQPVMMQGYKASDYTGMTNAIWDMHYYGWLTNYSTDQGTNNNFLGQMVQQVQQFTDADGKMAVLVGEYGNSTTGQAIDPNGNQVVAAVLNAAQNTGLSTAAWAWGSGNPGDGLTTGGNALSSYGQQVAAGIKAIAAKYTGSAVPPTSGGGSNPGTPVTPSANDTVVMAGSTAAITDASANKWTITPGGQIAVNGTTDATTANVKELAYVDGKVWQENASNLWWGKTSPSASWSPTDGTSTSPLPASATASITLRVSEDAYQGDAQFIVKVDGTQVGGTRTASALHSSGDSNVFVLNGNWASGSHQVAIQFLNDAYGGSAATDRNLYVDSIAYNGKTESGTSASMMSAGTKTFAVSSTAATVSGPADTVTVHLSGDAYNGNAQFKLLVDGKVVTTAQDVVASHAAGAWQDLSFAGNFGAGNHTIGVQFTNDAYGGSGAADRNLYVNGIDVNGTHYGSGVTMLPTNSTTNFAITTTH